MSVATKPTEQHGARAHSDGGWDSNEGAFVPVQTRSGRFTSNVHDDFPPITGREIEWKLSPIARFRPLVDDALDGSRYDIRFSETSGSSVEWLTREHPSIGSAGRPEERASANAWSAFEEALAITLRGDDAVDLTVTRDGLGDAPKAAHTVITAAPNSRGRVVIESRGSAALTENVEIVVGDHADLVVVSIQEWSDSAIHLSSHFATVGRGANLTHIIVTLGGSVVRISPSVHLTGEGATTELYGLYFASAGQHLEQRVYLHHVGQNTRGRVNYKGALHGEGARTVWVGDVLIGPNASGTDSYEQNRNLVLSTGTRADSIPNLEIETGNIIGAGHASATGRFDDEQLFYLQARGISEADARRLVVTGFLAEIVQKIGDPVLQSRLSTAIESELGGAA